MPSSCLLDELVAHRHHRSVDDSARRHDRYSPCRVDVGHDCRCDCRHTAHDCTYERECFLAHIFAPCLLKPLLISAGASGNGIHASTFNSSFSAIPSCTITSPSSVAKHGILK